MMLKMISDMSKPMESDLKAIWRGENSNDDPGSIEMTNTQRRIG